MAVSTISEPAISREGWKRKLAAQFDAKTMQLKGLNAELWHNIEMRYKYFASALSFMLPGLGQVYQRRYPAAAICFCVFTLLNFYSAGRWFIPLVAILAAFEAFRVEKKVQRKADPNAAAISIERKLGLVPFNENAEPPKKQKEEEKVRAPVFAGVGMLGFLAWMSLVSPAFLPIGNLMTTSDQAKKIEALVQTCRRRLNHLPQSLNECSEISADKLADPWGGSYQYRQTEQGFEIRTYGRDGKSGTDDDFKYSFR